MTAPTSEVTVAEETARPCPSCGAACNLGAKFCGKCGHAFIAAPAPAEPPAATAAHEPPPAVSPAAEPAQSERSESTVSLPPPQPGRSGKQSIVALAVASVVILAVFAWWLTSRSAAPTADQAVLPEPSAEASAPTTPELTSQPVPEASVPMAASPKPQSPQEDVIESGPVATPPAPVVDEAAQAQARRLKVEEEARQEQARREAQAQARQREQDKAKLNQANKTLDDLLK